MVQNSILTESDRGIVDPHYHTNTETSSVPGVTHPHWGSIWCGMFVALSTFAVLSALGAAIGTPAYDSNDSTRSWGLGTGLWAILSTIIAFALGGMVAARTTTHRDQKIGLFHGLM